MVKLHFFKADGNPTDKELQDMQDDIKYELNMLGRDDEVIVTRLVSWLGSIDIEPIQGEGY